MDENFAARLALAMARNHSNQSDVARALKISQASVSRWIAGAMPRMALAGKLAQFLECPLEWLINGAGPSPVYPFTDLKEAERVSKLPPAEALAEFQKEVAKSEETFPGRMRLLRETVARLGINEFARRVGYSASYISRLEAGKCGKPSLKFIEKVLQCFPSLNPVWVASGHLPVTISETPASDGDFTEHSRLLVIDGEEHGRRVEEERKNSLSNLLAVITREMPANRLAKIIEDVEALNTQIGTESADALKSILVRKLSSGQNEAKERGKTGKE